MHNISRNFSCRISFSCLLCLQLLLSTPTVSSRASSKIYEQTWGSYIGLLHVGITKTWALKYHRFLNKTWEIAGQDRDTHELFLHNAKTSQYARNIAQIDITDILRSVTVFGWGFRFLLDVELLKTPTALNQGNYGIYYYLWHFLNNSQFSKSIPYILFKEWRTTHRERCNQNRYAPKFKVGNASKSHVQVQSKSDTGKVEHLCIYLGDPSI